MSQGRYKVKLEKLKKIFNEWIKKEPTENEKRFIEALEDKWKDTNLAHGFCGGFMAGMKYQKKVENKGKDGKGEG